jgi:hypothetical protein
MIQSGNRGDFEEDEEDGETKANLQPERNAHHSMQLPQHRPCVMSVRASPSSFNFVVVADLEWIDHMENLNSHWFFLSEEKAFCSY